MPVTVTDLREIHGSVYVTETRDGQVVPWRALSLHDYLEYDSHFRNGIIASSLLEDEVFKKCVTDPVLVKNIHLQKAGTVTSVVKTIMEHSGPQNIDDFNKVMDHYRQVVAQPIHQLVNLICRAFPGYTPDDIYKMDYQLVLMRLAQAESKLLALGMITEPISITADEDKKTSPKSRKKIDPKKLKETFDLRGPIHLDEEEEDLDLGSTAEGEQFVVDSSMMVMGMEIGDENDAKAMKRDTKSIYGDYLEQIKHLKPGETVKIKTVEERVEEATKRAAANRKKNQEAAKKKKAGKKKK